MRRSGTAAIATWPVSHLRSLLGKNSGVFLRINNCQIKVYTSHINRASPILITYHDPVRLKLLNREFIVYLLCSISARHYYRWLKPSRLMGCIYMHELKIVVCTGHSVVFSKLNRLLILIHLLYNYIFNPLWYSNQPRYLYRKNLVILTI